MICAEILRRLKSRSFCQFAIFTDVERIRELFFSLFLPSHFNDILFAMYDCKMYVYVLTSGVLYKVHTIILLYSLICAINYVFTVTVINIKGDYLGGIILIYIYIYIYIYWVVRKVCAAKDLNLITFRTTQ